MAQLRNLSLLPAHDRTRHFHDPGASEEQESLKESSSQSNLPSRLTGLSGSHFSWNSLMVTYA